MAETSKQDATFVSLERSRLGIDSDRRGKRHPDTVVRFDPARITLQEFHSDSPPMAQINCALDSGWKQVTPLWGADAKPRHTRAGEEARAVTTRRFLDASRVFLALLHTAVRTRATRHRAGETYAVSSIGHGCSARTFKKGEKHVVR